MYRPLLPVSSILLRGYADALGMQNIVQDMHVTIAYSSTPVDLGTPAFETDNMALAVYEPGARKLSRFGDAVVLEFISNMLSARWAQLVMAGASWDFPEYRPHISLAYDKDIDFTAFPIPSIPLWFGSEIVEPLDENYIQSVA